MKAKLCVVICAALVAWALKRHYAEAQSDDLSWVLGPTARLVEVLTGAAFTSVPGEGYASRDRLFLIEKSCAGVNFIIAAFAVMVFALLHRVNSGLAAPVVLGVSLLSSYSAAVLVNAVRIAIAMWIATRPEGQSTFNAAAVHRIEGITVYFGGLLLLYEVVQRLDRGILAGGRPR